jgi:hypothetical protein
MIAFLSLLSAAQQSTVLEGCLTAVDQYFIDIPRELMRDARHPCAP